jgi:ribosome-associated protein
VTRSKKSESDSGRRLAVEAARLAEDRNAEDIVVLDLRGRSPVTDYFVIATGTSDRQIRSLADELERLGRSIDQKVWHVAGRESADWIVMDFVDVVVHLFNESLRTHYDLELIWGEAPRVRWRRPKRAAEHPDRN